MLKCLYKLCTSIWKEHIDNYFESKRTKEINSLNVLFIHLCDYILSSSHLHIKATELVFTCCIELNFTPILYEQINTYRIQYEIEEEQNTHPYSMLLKKTPLLSSFIFPFIELQSDEFELDKLGKIQSRIVSVQPCSDSDISNLPREKRMMRDLFEHDEREHRSNVLHKWTKKERV